MFTNPTDIYNYAARKTAFKALMETAYSSFTGNATKDMQIITNFKKIFRLFANEDTEDLIQGLDLLTDIEINYTKKCIKIVEEKSGALCGCYKIFIQNESNTVELKSLIYGLLAESDQETGDSLGLILTANDGGYICKKLGVDSECFIINLMCNLKRAISPDPNWYAPQIYTEA